jgi:hypothetical protein
VRRAKLTRPRAAAVAAALALVAAAVVVVLLVRQRGPEAPPAPRLPPPANRIVPDAFVARLHTEALGEAPDQDAWSAATSSFHARGCTTATLQEFARRIYTGEDYASRDYDAPERAITLYEGLLAREPDTAGVDQIAERLRGEGAWPRVVDSVLSSEEFTRLASAICAPASPAYAPAGATAPVDVGPAGEGFSGDQAALQAALDATPAGGTVRLAQRAVVRLSSPLRIPRGVTLTTAGEPDVAHYASMGRLVRTAPPPAGAEPSVVDLAAGATLRNVWVAGGRAWIGQPQRAAVTVRIRGSGATVESSKITDPLGGSSVFVTAAEYGGECRTATVRDNLITAYTSEHANESWADGISVACPRTSVSGNAIVDATDVGIVLYRVVGGTQASVVQDNRIIAAGRSAFAALAADPLMDGDGTPLSFRGASVRDNELWTGERTHIDIGLAVGTHAWFGDRSNKGAGASFTDNTTGSLSIRTQNPFAVDGMLDATVRGNTLRALPMGPSPCPPGPTVSRANGWASGSIQGPAKDQSLSGCIPLGG